MKRYLIDTPVLAGALLNRPAAVQLLEGWIRDREAATSILVYGEIVEYLKGFDDFPIRHEQLRRLLVEVTPHLLTYSILERYAELRREMRAGKIALIGDIDTLIGATALKRNLAVVAADGDFARVPRLRVIQISRRDLS